MKWIRRGIELGLVTAIAVGLYFASVEGRERAGLLADYERLRAMTGDMDATDPSKFYVLAIPTGEPLRFAWRFHGPKGTSLGVASFLGGGSSGTTMQTQAEDAIPTARVRLTADRGLEVHTNFQSSSGINSSGGNPGLITLLKGREAEIVVEQLGAPMTPLRPGTQALLRLKLSDALIKEAEKILSPAELARFPGGEIYRIEITYTPPPSAAPGGTSTSPEATP